MLITDQTIEQLRAATVTQIRTALKNKIDLLTKKQLIEFILDFVDVFPSPLFWTYRKDKQPLTMLELSKDALGVKLGSRRVTWSYYGDEVGTPVDTITIETLDAADKVTVTRVVKHYKDGRQPSVNDV